MWTSSKSVWSTVTVWAVVLLGVVRSRHVEQRPTVTFHAAGPTSGNNVNSAESCVGSNCTLYKLTTFDVDTSTESDAESPPPPFWCPNNYDLSSAGDIWYHLCKPQPCVHLPAFDGHDEYSVYEKPQANVLVVNETKGHRRVCAKDLKRFSTHFTSTNCQKVGLSSDDFQMDNDGGLIDRVANRTLPIGEYFLQMDQAIVCKDLSDNTKHSSRVIWSCIPFDVPLNRCTIVPNGSLIVNDIQVEISPGFYHVDNNNTTAHVCFPTNAQLESCPSLIDIELEDQLRLLDNFTLYTNKRVEDFYPVGDYILSEDQTHAVVCTKFVEPVKQTTYYIYGVASIVSAVFSLATLLVHLIFPNINHHARSLLCHILSLFLMYLTAAVRYFVNSFPVGAARLVVFGCQYIFSLSTFCWLNVLAFELWHVFAKFQGYIAPGPRNEKKRWFLVKCAYSWGVPIILSQITIGISLSPTAQQKLGLQLPLSETIWFSDEITIFAFFYGPILAILLVNLVLFGWTIWNIKKLNRGSDILNSKISRQLFRVFVKLFVVMGLCWFAEILSWYLWDKTFEELWYLTDLINCLQGLAIFIIYVCKQSTVRAMKKRLNGELGGGSQSTKSTSSQDRGRRNVDNGASPSIAMRTLSQPTSSSNNNNNHDVQPTNNESVEV